MRFLNLHRAAVVLLVSGVLGSTLAGCAWVDAQQRARGYRPTPGTMAEWKPVSATEEVLWLELPPAPDGRAQGLRAIWMPADDAAAPAVLYLHGTFRNLYRNQPKIAAIHAAGFSVLAVDYRGWGESSSLLPSEQSIMEDAERTWSEFARRAPDAHSRVIFGHSMGSGVAIELALRHRDPPAYGALVVEAGMTSMPDLVRDAHPLGFVAAPWVTQQFASIDKIGRIDVPKWFIAGSADKTVPPLQSRALHDAAQPPKHLLILEGGSHSGLHEEFAADYRALWHDVAASLERRRTAGSAASAP